MSTGSTLLAALPLALALGACSSTYQDNQLTAGVGDNPSALVEYALSQQWTSEQICSEAKFMDTFAAALYPIRGLINSTKYRQEKVNELTQKIADLGGKISNPGRPMSWEQYRGYIDYSGDIVVYEETVSVTKDDIAARRGMNQKLLARAIDERAVYASADPISATHHQAAQLRALSPNGCN